MPKPVRDLEKIQRPLEERVSEFLANDRENAYSLQELAASVEGGSTPNSRGLMLLVFQMTKDREEVRKLMSAYEEALKKLVVQKRVRTFTEGAVTYYAAAGRP